MLAPLLHACMKLKLLHCYPFIFKIKKKNTSIQECNVLSNIVLAPLVHSIPHTMFFWKIHPITQNYMYDGADNKKGILKQEHLNGTPTVFYLSKVRIA